MGGCPAWLYTMAGTHHAGQHHRDRTATSTCRGTASGGQCKRPYLRGGVSPIRAQPASSSAVFSSSRVMAPGGALSVTSMNDPVVIRSTKTAKHFPLPRLDGYSMASKSAARISSARIWLGDGSPNCTGKTRQLCKAAASCSCLLVEPPRVSRRLVGLSCHPSWATCPVS